MSAVKPAVVGAFVLSGFVLAVGATLLFGGTHLFRPTVHAVVYFQGSVAGLEIGAPVTFRGVRVGSVTKIAVNLNLKDLSARIPVFLDLNPSQVAFENGTGGGSEGRLGRMIEAGLQAQLNMQSLITGQLQVELDLTPGNEIATVRGDPDRPEIPSIPSKLQRLEDEIAELPLKEIADNASQTLASIQNLADTLSARVGPLADSLKGTSDAAHATLDDIDRLAVDGRHQLKASGDELGRVLVSSDRTVREAESLLASLKEMTAPNSQIRGDLQAAIRDLAASASALRGFTHEIERDPSAILSGRTAH
jgi:paraquat-inducible protein B